MDTGSSGEILNQYADDGADLDATKEGGDSLKQELAEENLLQILLFSADIESIGGCTQRYSNVYEKISMQTNVFQGYLCTAHKDIETHMKRYSHMQRYSNIYEKIFTIFTKIFKRI